MRTTQGREYAKLSDLKPGDMIEIDGGFEEGDCFLKAGAQFMVHAEDQNWLDRLKRKPKELYFNCGAGYHALEGQLDDDGDYLIGVYKIGR